MKTISRLGLLWVFLAMLLVLPVTVQADFFSDPYYYTTNNGTVTITGYDGPDGVLSITNKIDDLPVTSIGDSAFNDCSGLNDVTIPNGVTSLGSNAFCECTHLLCITIPDSVTNIGYQAFYDCGLTNVMIGTNVTSIGDDAFYGCESLTSVTIPNSVTSLGSNAFCECRHLLCATIGNSVTSLGDSAFYDCQSLTAIMVDTNNHAYSSLDGVLFDKGQTTLIQCPAQDIAGTYVIPNGVTDIGKSAFSLCAYLFSVTIPNSVTNIGYGSFDGCSRLYSAYFKGNAPSDDGAEFHTSIYNDPDPVTVFYLPGTTNWGTSFGDRPTMLWNPQVHSDANFGVGTNGFGFTVSGSSNLDFVVQACTNLLSPDWLDVKTMILTGGSSCFSDPDWTNCPARFYRFCAP